MLAAEHLRTALRTNWHRVAGERTQLRGDPQPSAFLFDLATGTTGLINWVPSGSGC
jgi:hypothetical protein